MTDLLDALSDLIEQDAWLVGGAVRDRLLGRSTADFDVAVAGPPEASARALARRLSAHPFPLSDTFGGWRLVAKDRCWQLDLLPLTGRTIQEDLAARDLTINAIAQPLRDRDLLDPFGGVSDLRSGVLRMVTPGAFSSDPLRVLRTARLACDLSFAVESETASMARCAAIGLGDVAAERVFAELKLIVSSEHALRGLSLMHELGATDVILPELSRLRGMQQSHYHHLDVHNHTGKVLEEVMELEESPERLFPDLAQALRQVLAEPLANDLSRGQALRLGALLHDIAKPQTRAQRADGRVTFIGHDEQGAEVTQAILHRLRASERLIEHVARLVRHHLRLGFLVHAMPLDRRAVYNYLQACGPVAVDVTLLSVADRLATRGRGAEPAIARHLELAREMLPAALDWRRSPPRPPVRGDELARALELKPGPLLGRLLAELEAAAYAGELRGPDQAIIRARELLRTSAEL